MWIVLVDHSGSMGEPFQASDDSSRRARVTDAEIKLQAAKEVLRKSWELKDAFPDMSIAIFAFTSVASLAYQGPVADLPAIDRALDALSPHNGTDIAAALNAAADYKAGLTETGLAELVLISDGKSDRVQAMAAARRCLEQGLPLRMFLIDPTEEGKGFARDVVRGVGGTYQPVTSRTDLQDAAKDVSQSYSRAQARAERFLESTKAEARRIEEEVADRERVTFTAAYPGRIEQAHDYPLRVFLHLATHLEDVQARLKRDADQFGAPRREDVEASRDPPGHPARGHPQD